MDILFGIALALAYTAAIGFLIFGLDDFLFDLQFVRYLWRTRANPHVSTRDLRSKPEGRIALFVPAWKEGGVVNRMADYAVRILEYERYDIFIGVYPNDPETIACVDAITQTCPRIHKAVCPNPGPTSKADCLNAIFQAMRLHEIPGTREYDLIALHDAEDVLHPLTLKVYNYFVPDMVDMGQIPVFPLELPPWKYWVANTYMDEFSELHLKDMFARQEIGGVVPSAGVGTAFSRRAIDHLAYHNNEEPFYVGNLTEDYFIAVQLKRAGFSVGFINYPVDRVVTKTDAGGKIISSRFVTEIVAVRENFPSQFAAAVRQRSRWILGISMQCWELAGWSGSLPIRYTLLRDRRAPFVHVINTVGYFVILFWIMEWFIRQTGWGSLIYWPPLFQAHSLLWGIVLVDTCFLLYRILIKVFFVRQIYGLRQGLFSIARYPLGNIINFCATVRALWMYLGNRLLGKPLVWLKTTHVFPGAAELAEFSASIRDLILERGIVSRDLLEILQPDSPDQSLLGRLLDLHLIEEEQFTEVWSRFSSIPERTITHDEVDMRLLGAFPEEDSHAWGTLPIAETPGGVLVAFLEPPDPEVRRKLETRMGREISACLITPTNMRILRDTGYAALALPHFRPRTPVREINPDDPAWRQAEEIHIRTGRRMSDIAVAMNLVSIEDCRRLKAENFQATACSMTHEHLDPEAFEILGPLFCYLHRLAPLRGGRLIFQESIHPEVLSLVRQRLGFDPVLVADRAAPTRHFLRTVFHGLDQNRVLLDALVGLQKISAAEADGIFTLRRVLNEPIHWLLEQRTRLTQQDLYEALSVISRLPTASADARPHPKGLLRPGFFERTRVEMLEAEDGRVTLGLRNLLEASDFSQVCSRMLRYAVRFVLLPPAP